MSDLKATIPGRPGPKGSTVSFCLRCAHKHLPQQIATKEQSKVGEAFRRVIAKALRRPKGSERTTATQTVAWVYIERQKQVRGGVALDTYVPSSMTPAPISQQSGDIEKHARNLHDALQDAHILADDAIVTDLIIRKRWATEEHPAGIEIEISDAPL